MISNIAGHDDNNKKKTILSIGEHNKKKKIVTFKIRLLVHKFIMRFCAMVLVS